jgi:hypothetical protein
MILLDTDHFPVFLDERDPRHELLHANLSRVFACRATITHSEE